MPTMLIAQITDLHLGFVPDDPDEPNSRRLEQIVTHLRAGPNRPDVIVASGDLADRGDAASYRRVRKALAALPGRVYPMVGNHDERGAFAEVFPEIVLADGFVQYCVTLDGVRLIMIDTLEVGRHGGGFCPARAAWLAARLAEDTAIPTVIVMHHPPFASGLAWMDPAQGEPWIARFASAIANHRQIVAIWCGHLHRAIATNWNGVTITVSPSVSPELALDLRAIEPAVPDERAMIRNGPPGLAWHRWHGGQLVTLFDTLSQHQVLARFDDGMRPLVESLAAERSDASKGH